MEAHMNQVIEYLKNSIDRKASFCKWDAKEKLNLQMAGNYEYYIVSVLDMEFLLIEPRESMTTRKIKVQFEYIKQKTDFDIALLLENGLPYQMKRMLENRIPFISADKQMYLPFMALHIKIQNNKTSAETKKMHEQFTDATQLIYLYLLYREASDLSAQELAAKLNLSTMTVLRGMNELEQIGVVRHEIAGKTGRKKLFKRIEKKEYYHIGKEYLRNPLKETIHVKYIPSSVKALKSGLYALSEQTMLGQPAREIYAVERKNEVEFKDITVTKMQAMEEGLPEVQLMKYNLEILTENDCVDPITLIKSLDENDDRIEIAIDEMMEDLEWYEV